MRSQSRLHLRLFPEYQPSITDRTIKAVYPWMTMTSISQSRDRVSTWVTLFLVMVMPWCLSSSFTPTLGIDLMWVVGCPVIPRGGGRLSLVFSLRKTEVPAEVQV